MKSGILEHVNVTATDPERTAKFLCEVFDWKIRWSGPSLGDGWTMHVGSDDNYIALYAPKTIKAPEHERFVSRGGLNHVGVVVDDLGAVEARLKALGVSTHSHQTYEPGSRFYFYDDDGVEWEVVSYA